LNGYLERRVGVKGWKSKSGGVREGRAASKRKGERG